MKIKSKNIKIFIAITFIYISLSLQVSGQQVKNEFYMAMELNNVLCGYSRVLLSDSTVNGMKVSVLHQNTFANFFALGRDLTQYQEFTYHIDPRTGNFIYHDSYHKQGDMEFGESIYVEGNNIRIRSLEGSEEIISKPTDDIILPNMHYYNYLLRDFIIHNEGKKTYTVFDVRTGKIRETTYTREGDEKLELAGDQYDTVILTEKDPATGLDTKIWIDKETGMRLKILSSNRISMYLTDATVPAKIKTGNWDNIFFTKTNKFIDDIRSISYMKVKASLEPVPASRMEDINVAGQKFTGQVDNKIIEGVFEVSHKKYDGNNAPLFPFEPNQYNQLEPYLTATEQIESDDSILIATARDVTEKSGNLWEAVCNLSLWVADNIDGSILGGSARETYDHKSGLCGSQSMLMAALCRACGIPARVVWGCLYTPEYGGSFGHHAWNEIFMGDSGWIPIDVTIHETDYIDSGHIRFGVLETRQTQINSWKMDIMEFRNNLIP